MRLPSSQPARSRRTDADIARAVRHVLAVGCAQVPDELIQSTVSDGWVTLDGERANSGTNAKRQSVPYYDSKESSG